ncbi:endoribonuclease Dicer homolog 2 isoform X6 [Vigna angularis]|uniref:endoribonuclease Dicer homolog 2 isoform X6 n=1 Tax=Phaseolus angularis TaxID=3914 RepID=UPI0022B4D9F9|nr:endoribonuclease Dicer homolog 2 isoform X6 [Vigna angularis]
MEEALVGDVIDNTQQQNNTRDVLPFARSYQLEALDNALRENTIVYLETGSGKTLIAIMLLRSYAHHLRKPSSSIAVFLVPQVVLVSQQSEVVKKHTDLKVGTYWGAMGVDFWDAAMWKQEVEKHEVLVMTPAILLSCLRHSFLKLNMIKVLIMDECHHARGKHPYACIMTEFYHHQLNLGVTDLPRIFGMTASPIKSKVGNSELSWSENIRTLITLMHSKVYTCVSEAVLAEFMPSSTPKFKFYRDSGIQFALFEDLALKLKILKEQHGSTLRSSDFTKSAAESAEKRIAKIFCALMFCLDELGVWLTLKAAESLSSNEFESFSWGHCGDTVVKNFILACVQTLKTYLPCGPQWSIGNNIKSDVEMGLLTTKVCCLIDSLLEYRGLTDIRCIIFVQRVVTAIVLQDLLNTLLPTINNWKTKFIAGHKYRLQNQSRKEQNKIVEEFHLGLVNIIVATSILEEGLDVQTCNLVIRFDPSPTVCSFIQSRGRARMKNSDYLLIVKSGDSATCSRLEKYLASGDIMRKEALRYSSLPCDPFEGDQFDEETYRVANTDAFANLSSSISLIHLYCSRLPADGYFKPAPRWDKETATLYLPKSCPLKPIHVEGDKNLLKNIACLEACKQLHKIGALTDNLVPDIVIEEAEMEEFVMVFNCNLNISGFSKQNTSFKLKITVMDSESERKEVLEAITTKGCKEAFHYESLETLGDSFLKYAASQLLFKTYQNHHEGLLSVKREKIISNTALCKLGCNSGLAGFIRNAPFDPNVWIIPGDYSRTFKYTELITKGKKNYVYGKRKLKRKIIADVVEALIGAFLSTGGEKAALMFMDWVGIKVSFDKIAYDRHFDIQPEKLVNVEFLESKLKYSFHDRSLLVEALTHGSYMLPEVPRCYQRLEFLGDSVLDYLITWYLYNKYPGMSPGQLTDMRSASVNNDCYAWSTIKHGLHKHVLHASQELHMHIAVTLDNFEKLSSSSTFGYECETSLPKVLGDILEALAGAILVDSGYNKEVVWQSIKPLLEPLVTPETLKLHPIREFYEVCQKKSYKIIQDVVSSKGGVTNYRMEVEADGVIHEYEYIGAVLKDTAKKIVCKELLNSLKK